MRLEQRRKRGFFPTACFYWSARPVFRFGYDHHDRRGTAPDVVAQAYPFTKPRTPADFRRAGDHGVRDAGAIGAALAKPDARVVCVSGDGSLLMNIQELATLADLNFGHHGYRDEQPPSRIGSPTAGVVLRRPLLLPRVSARSPISLRLRRVSALPGLISGRRPIRPTRCTSRLPEKGPGLSNLPVSPCRERLSDRTAGKANHEMIEPEVIPCAIS